MKFNCFGIWLTLVLLALASIGTASAVELPQFKSGVSAQANYLDNVDFDQLYSKVDAVYDVMEHDSNHIVFKFSQTTGDGVFINKNGTVVIASTAGLDTLTNRDKLGQELGEVFSILRLVGWSISYGQTTYYAEDDKVFRVLEHSFDRDFTLSLSVPNCTINSARLSIRGPDFVDSLSDYRGQHYYIDGDEVSGCDIELGYSSDTCKGVSCSDCYYEKFEYDLAHCWVTVGQADITTNIPYGLHTITSSDVDNEHDMTIEAITSPSEKPMVLYNTGRTIWVEDKVLSRPLNDLYILIT